jgi:hypothetical protein
MARSIKQQVRSLELRGTPTLGGEPTARLRWRDQITTPVENQLHPCSEHSCAHRHSHDFGKLFGDCGRQITETRSFYEHHPAGRSKTV